MPKPNKVSSDVTLAFLFNMGKAGKVEVARYVDPGSKKAIIINASAQPVSPLSGELLESPSNTSPITAEEIASTFVKIAECPECASHIHAIPECASELQGQTIFCPSCAQPDIEVAYDQKQYRIVKAAVDEDMPEDEEPVIEEDEGMEDEACDMTKAGDDEPEEIGEEDLDGDEEDATAKPKVEDKADQPAVKTADPGPSATVANAEPAVAPKSETVVEPKAETKAGDDKGDEDKEEPKAEDDEEDAKKATASLKLNVFAASDLTKGKLDLVLASDDKDSVWHVFHNHKPVASLFKSKASSELHSIFDKNSFADAFKVAASAGLTEADAQRFGAEPVTLDISIDEAIAKKVEQEVKAEKEAINKAVDTAIETNQQTLATAALGIVKGGVWPTIQNPVREKLVASLKANGVRDPEVLVDKAMAEGMTDFLKSVFAKAQELTTKSVEVRNEVATYVEQASFVAGNRVAEVAADSLSKRLEEGSVRLVTSPENTGSIQTPTTAHLQGKSVRELYSKVSRRAG